MSLRRSELEVIVADIRAALVGGRVQEIRQPEPTRLSLQVRAPGETHQLVVELAPRHAGLTLSLEKHPNSPIPSAFLMKLRKELSSRIVAGVALAGQDRCVMLSLHPFPQEATAPSLLLELTGHHPNAFLLDPHGIIVVQAVPNRSKRRALWPGHPYHPPESSPPDDRLSRLTGQNAAERMEAARALLAEEQQRHLQRDAAQHLARAAKAALKHQRRKEGHIWSDLERAEEAEALRRRAELLKAIAPTLRRGTTAASVVDYYDPALSKISIPLDPAVDPTEQVQRLFHRARRLDEARAGIELRLERVTARREALETALHALECLTEGDAAIETLRARLLELGVKLEQQPPPTRSEQQARQVYREFAAADGTPILVGKGAKENDQLTLRIARADDIWLHATGRRGAHVILRASRGSEPPLDALLDAAALAAWYAEGGQTDSGVEVAYTRRRNVHKRRGFAPGMVSMSQVRTLFVTPDEARMNRLFAREGFSYAGDS